MRKFRKMLAVVGNADNELRWSVDFRPRKLHERSTDISQWNYLLHINDDIKPLTTDKALPTTVVVAPTTL